MESSVFTKIINGDIPCHKVYEDEHTFAFMDIQPVQDGMVVVVPKQQYDYFENLPHELVAPLFESAQTITKALKAVFPNKKRVALRIEGLDVPHVHVVLYPIDSGEEFRALPAADEPDHDKLSDIAQQLRNQLEKETNNG